MRCYSLLFVLVFFSTFYVGASTSNPLVTLEQGPLSGISEQGLSVFKGVPFAQPPIGNLRWQPPKPLSDWRETRSAHEFANQCMQKYIYDDMRFRSKGTSEDCLYLNIWAPEEIKKNTPLLPVLVYFYGGGFRAGDGSEPRYDGAAMAQQGIVVVTVNYRLGIFGLLAHPELTGESEYGGSGNYTFLDQQSALTWVNRNIHHFGGDPKRVTIGGESAGSISVSAHLVSPLSKDLVAGAIGQSGAMVGPPIPALPLAQAHLQGQALTAKLATRFSLKPDNIIAQLRLVTGEELLEATESLQSLRLSPTVDGLFMPEQPSKLYSQGKFADVPILAGVNSQEGAYSWILGATPIIIDSYKQALKGLYPEHFEQVLTLYPAKTPEQIKDALQDLASDRFISFGTWNWLDQVTELGTKPTYYYVYDHVRPARKAEEGGTGKHTDRGAVHSAEIEYALGNLDTNPLYLWQPEDYKVSARLQGYFVQFIKTGNPNGKSLAPWPMMSTGGHLLIGSELSTRVSSDELRARYQFHRNYFKRLQ